MFNPDLGFVLEDRLPEVGVLGLEGFKAAAGHSVAFPEGPCQQGAPCLLHVPWVLTKQRPFISFVHMCVFGVPPTCCNYFPF